MDLMNDFKIRANFSLYEIELLLPKILSHNF